MRVRIVLYACVNVCIDSVRLRLRRSNEQLCGAGGCFAWLRKLNRCQTRYRPLVAL